MKILFTWIIILLVSFQGHSQHLKTDSTLIPNSQLKIALKKIEAGKAAEAELSFQQQQNELLVQKLMVKDSVIRIYQAMESNYVSIVAGFHREITTYQQQVILEHQVRDALSRSLKKQKQKTFLVGLSGVISTLGLTYFLIK